LGRIVRACLNKSGDTIRWLEEKGLDFEWLSFLIRDQDHKVYHVPKGDCLQMVKTLVKKCEDLNVRILRQTRMKNILKDKKGNVTGIVADTKNKELLIKSRSVIIATGGYGANKEFLQRYYPYETKNLYYFGAPSLMGDGLQTAIEIGADTEGLGTLLAHAPWYPAGWQTAIAISSVALEPYTVWVNKRAERYMDESIPLSFLEGFNALEKQPGNVSYHIFDEKIKKSMIKKGIKEGAGEIWREHFLPETLLPELENRLKSEEKKGRVKISEKWDDIAQWIGASPEALKATIEEYNHFCDRGYDEIFNKDRKHLLPLRNPPFYVLKCVQGFLDTTGGIKINHHMEVLNSKDKPIPGLYAAGVVAGGWEAKTYCFIFSGSAVSFAVNSGRIAGESAVEYISSQ
jgi:fumarate reductase flavoprotein subunit